MCFALKINKYKTKYFRLRLSYEVSSERPEILMEPKRGLNINHVICQFLANHDPCDKHYFRTVSRDLRKVFSFKSRIPMKMTGVLMCVVLSFADSDSQ